MDRDAAADAAGEPAADVCDHHRVVTVSFGGVEVDQLHTWKPRESPDPDVGVGRLNRELVALHQLDDAAALEID
jgi:hypothetical protein